jgi:mono/diheme cytochrome c family protein
MRRFILAAAGILLLGAPAQAQQSNPFPAQVKPDEIDDVVNYLATNFGPGVPVPGPAPTPVTLPAGAGADLVTGACGTCHGVDRVVAVARPGQQWEAIVHRMVAIGAPIDADQTTQIISYLKANYGAASSKAP